MLSRNTPIALVVGAGGFIGSFLVEELLNKKIQVVGVDNFSTGRLENLTESSKDKLFHLVNQSAADPLPLGLPRLDYAFFLLPEDMDHKEYTASFENFLRFTKLHKAKIVMLSTIDAYGKKHPEHPLKSAEKKLAVFAKETNANARIIRLAPVYGPRMNFRHSDPITSLVQAALNSDLQRHNLSLDFTTRSVYVSDVVNLLIKSVLAGGTAHKIYDAALLHPIKISEVGEVLLDPLWYETRNFQPTHLPPWPTPNIERTIKELHWHPQTSLVEALKNTIVYFKDKPELYRQKPVMEARMAPAWETREAAVQTENVSEHEQQESREEKTVSKHHEVGEQKFRFKPNFGYLRENKALLFGLALIIFGLLYPIVDLLLGGLTIRAHLKNSNQALVDGDFKRAEREIQLAKSGVSQIESVVSSAALLEKFGPTANFYKASAQLTQILEDSVQASQHAVSGTEALYQSAKVVSGAENGDLPALFDKAGVELTSADRLFSTVQANLQNEQFKQSVPEIFKSRTDDLSDKINSYQEVISKGRSVAYLLPQVVALNGSKSYLVLLQNNMELRPGGGFIGSYAKVDFENGKLKNLKVDDIYNLDGQLKEHVEPPIEIRNDLGQKDWYLRDSNMEPDFPSNARLAEWFYQKESGQKISGVITLDLSAAQKLLNAVGPLELTDYQERIDANNLFERAIAHAEVSFFPGSQAKKNFLTALGTELFNNIFYLPKQNWPEIIKAIGGSLDEKHLMVYLSDQTLFSYVTSQGWSGVLPRQVKAQAGERNEFLAVSEANLGANKVNYYLERSMDLKTRIGKEGEVNHTLTIHYTNGSPTDVWPGGQYKNRIKFYLASGSKLVSAKWGGEDITKNVTSYNDYGRLVLSTLVTLQPKERKDLVLEYADTQPIDLKDGKFKLNLDVIKQPGTVKDRFDYTVGFSINYKPTSIDAGSKQELNFSTELTRNRNFNVEFIKTK